MKFCAHCGNELNDEAVVCVKCGCAANSTPNTSASAAAAAPKKKSSVSLILGIVGIVSAWLFALVGHITSIIGIVFGVKEYNETGNMAGLVVSIIGEICAIISSVIGVLMVM